MSKYLCLRNCFVNVVLWKEGKVYDLPDEMEKSPKNFRLVGEPAPAPAPEPAPQPTSEAQRAKIEPVKEVAKQTPLICPSCGRECKSDFGLKSHMRSHK